MREMQSMDAKWLLRPGEVAVALGIGRSKVYSLLATGVIPSVRVGGSVRVPVEALRAWITTQLEVGRPLQAEKRVSV
jgi:excisionase family DNA binding protein